MDMADAVPQGAAEDPMAVPAEIGMAHIQVQGQPRKDPQPGRRRTRPRRLGGLQQDQVTARQIRRRQFRRRGRRRGAAAGKASRSSRRGQSTMKIAPATSAILPTPLKKFIQP